MSTNALSALSDWVDRHKRGLPYVFYAAAAAGAATILHSVRAVSHKSPARISLHRHFSTRVSHFQFSHFKSAAEIPAHFFRRGTHVNGVVQSGGVSVSREGDVLLSVDHTPIVSLWRRKGAAPVADHIPVRVASVTVDSGHKAAAQLAAEQALSGAGRKVRFCPLDAAGGTVAAVVYVNRRALYNADLGRRLVKLGLASSAPFETSLAGHIIYEKYYARLVKLENAASRKKIGMWEEEEMNAPPSLLTRVYKSLLSRRRKK